MDSKHRANFLMNRAHLILAVAILVSTTLFFLALFCGLLARSVKIPWRAIFLNPELRAAAILTSGCTAAATVVASFFGLGCAYTLSRRDFPGKAVVETILDFPLVLPPLVSGVALLIFFGPIMGGSLRSIGIIVVYTPLGVIIAQSFIATPFAIKMFREAFSAIDPRYEHIARTLGCPPIQVFARVTIPLARRGIISGIAMTWARTVGEFGATATLAGITRMKTETLSAAVFLSMSAGELDTAIAISVVLLMAAFIILFILRIGTNRRKSHGELV